MNKYIEEIDKQIERAYGGCGKEHTEGDNTWICGKKIGDTNTRFYCADDFCQANEEKLNLLKARKRGYLDAVSGDSA